jgi:hypothetical protein
MPHEPGVTCFRAVKDKLSVIDISGFHTANVQYCECAISVVPRRTQLLKNGLFPATVLSPKTATTLQCLKLLNNLNEQGRLSVHDFHQALWDTTDKFELSPHSVSPFLLLIVCVFSLRLLAQKRYDRLSVCIRFYRHLLLLKHAGRGHVSGGSMSFKDGELALDCIPCLLPGINTSIDQLAAIPDDKL